jgi:hypothetical protein
MPRVSALSTTHVLWHSSTSAPSPIPSPNSAPTLRACEGGGGRGVQLDAHGGGPRLQRAGQQGVCEICGIGAGSRRSLSSVSEPQGVQDTFLAPGTWSQATVCGVASPLPRSSKIMSGPCSGRERRSAPGGDDGGGRLDGEGGLGPTRTEGRGWRDGG